MFERFFFRYDIFTIVVFASFFFPLSFAESRDGIQPFKSYSGLSVGIGHFSNACGTGVIKCSNDSFVTGVRFGFPLMSDLYFEAGLTDYGHPKAEYNVFTNSIDFYGIDLSFLFSLELSQRWQMFGRIGGVWQHIEKKNEFRSFKESNEWNSVLGLGAQYQLSDSWEIRGELQYIDGVGDAHIGQSDLYLSTISFVYHFGQQEPKVQGKISSRSREFSTNLPKNTYHRDIFFNFDSSLFTASSKLNKSIKKLAKTSIVSIVVTGHTDGLGSEEYNQKLSEKRAKSVVDYLLAQGIDRHLITMVGVGEREPIADNSTHLGRDKNRRVEVLIDYFE